MHRRRNSLPKAAAETTVGGQASRTKGPSLSLFALDVTIESLNRFLYNKYSSIVKPLVSKEEFQGLMLNMVSVKAP